MPAGGRNIGRHGVGRLDGLCHLDGGRGTAGPVVCGGHRVDAQPVGDPLGQHRGEGVIRQVLVAEIRHLPLDLRVIAGEGGRCAEGLGRAHRRPHRAVGTRGETAEHPRVALVGGIGEIVADERGDFVRGPRVDGGSILDIRAVVRLLVDAQGRDDDDGGRDDPGIDGVVEGLLDVGTLRGAVGLARVPVQQLDDRVGLAVGGGVVAWCDDEDGQRDAADRPRPRGGEHAVLGPREGRVEAGGSNRLVADCNLAARLGHRFVDVGSDERSQVTAGLDEAERAVEDQGPRGRHEKDRHEDEDRAAQPMPRAPGEMPGCPARQEERPREEGQDREHGDDREGASRGQGNGSEKGHGHSFVEGVDEAVAVPR